MRRGSQLRQGQACNGGSSGADAAPGVQRRRGIGNGGSSGAWEAAATGEQLLPRRSCSWGAVATGEQRRRVWFGFCFLFFWRLRNGRFGPVTAGFGERRRPPRVFLTCLPALPSVSQVRAQRISPLPYPFGFCCYFLMFRNCVFGMLIIGGALQFRWSPPAPQPCPPACRLHLSLMPRAKPPPSPFGLFF